MLCQSPTLWKSKTVVKKPSMRGGPFDGLRVARAIAAELSGADPPPPFDGKGFCPIELGTGSAARVEGDWYATPEPIITIDGPSTARAGDKAEFEHEHLARWFGS